MLTEFDAYPAWNPFIRRLEGEFREGERVRARMQPPGSPGGTYTSTLTKVDPPREFCWAGGLPGLFTYEHAFIIEPLEQQRVRFEQREPFAGALAPLFWLIFIRFTRRGFEAMNAALKERAEAA